MKSNSQQLESHIRMRTLPFYNTLQLREAVSLMLHVGNLVGLVLVWRSRPGLIFFGRGFELRIF